MCIHDQSTRLPRGKLGDSVASLISSAWTKLKVIFLLFSAFLLNSLHIIHSLVSFCLFGALSHDHFVPTPISHFPPFSASATHSSSYILPQSVFDSVSISIYVSLFGINLRTVSWSPNFFVLSLFLYLIISPRTRLNSYMWRKETVEWSRVGVGGGRKRGQLGGCCSRGLRENGFRYSMFIGSCQLQSTWWCIIQVSFHGALCSSHFLTDFQHFLRLLLWPQSFLSLSPSSSTSLYSPLSYLCLLLLISHLLRHLHSSFSSLPSDHL